jgi:branched-chain amino acid transport system substrate-binding protein
MKKFSLTSLMIFVACVFIFSGYAQAKKAPKAILLGTPAPMTGMFAGFGEGSVFGMKAAIEDMNKLGGVYIKEYGKKLPVKLIVRDVESNPIKTGTLAEDMVVRDKVHALISPPEPVTLHGPVATIADRYKVPHVIGGGPFEPWNGMRMQIDPPWEYSWLMGFRIVMPYPPGDFRAKPGYTIKDSWFGMMDDFAKRTNKIAGVFASDDPDGVGWYGLFPGALKEWGTKVIGIEKKLGLFPMGTTDFTPIIKEWKKNKVEILWGNSPAPDFGTLWRQAHVLGFKPKIAMVGRAPLFYSDVKSWGGDLPWGIAVEIWWDSSYPPEFCPGIGGTTAKSLHERWTKATGQPLNPGIGGGYFSTQVMLDAIERAGTLDGGAINKAIAETDMKTISCRVKFIKDQHFSGVPLSVGQWIKTKKPHVWEVPVIYSQHDWLKPTHKPLYPLP